MFVYFEMSCKIFFARFLNPFYLKRKRCCEDGGGTACLVLFKLCSHWMVALKEDPWVRAGDGCMPRRRCWLLQKGRQQPPGQTKSLCQQQSSNCVHATELLWVLSSTDRPALRAALRVLCDHRRSADAALVGCIGVINAGKRTNTVKLANNL